MTLRQLTLVLAIALVAEATAQNQAPVVSNIKAVADTSSKTIAITYDLSDPENEDVKITLKAARGENDGFLVPVIKIAGDVGYPVKSGPGKKITWHYADTIKNIAGYRIKIAADDLYKISIEELVSQVDSNNLRRSLDNIAGERFFKSKKGLVHLNQVKDTIENRFANYRLNTYRHRFVYGNYVAHNIIGRKAGSGDESKVYILCSHFDTVKDSPGADDNGSGVAGMFEAARILSQYNFKYAINFVGFDLEEQNLIGSMMYLMKGGKKKYEVVEGAINFDMIGYASDRPNTQLIPKDYELVFPEVCKDLAASQYRSDFVLNTSNGYSESLSNKFSNSITTYVPDLKQVSLVAYENGEHTPELASSDHKVFWYRRYKAIHVGDGGASRNTNLDSRKDTIEKLNFTFMCKVVKATIATLAELAEIEHSTVAYSNVTVGR